jgi:hypothetical protein
MNPTVILIGFPKAVDKMPLGSMWQVKTTQPLNNRRGQIQVVLERC